MRPLPAITFGSRSDIGRIRRENQDAWGRLPVDDRAFAVAEERLFIVADGMGGHRGGAQASRIAVETIQQSFLASASSPIDDRLREAFQKANDAIRRYGSENLPDEIIGTTCTALAIKGDAGWIGHIGDSRAYRITGSSIRQLTRDHSNVAEMVRNHLLTKEEAKNHPERSMLTRALGVADISEIDTVGEFSLGDNEWYLMCSDGLANNVEEQEMKDLVLSGTPMEACDSLVNLALERGGQDNITVLVIQLEQEPTVVNKMKRFFGR